MEHAFYTVLLQSDNVILTYLDLEAILKHAAMSKAFSALVAASARVLGTKFFANLKEP